MCLRSPLIHFTELQKSDDNSIQYSYYQNFTESFRFMTQLSVALLQWMHSGVGLLTLRFFLYCTLCFATISCLCDASRWQCVTFIFKSPHYNATHPTPSTHTANLMPLKGIFPTACCFCRGPSRLSLVTLVAPLLAKEGTGA